MKTDNPSWDSPYRYICFLIETEGNKYKRRKTTDKKKKKMNFLCTLDAGKERMDSI